MRIAGLKLERPGAAMREIPAAVHLAEADTALHLSGEMMSDGLVADGMTRLSLTLRDLRYTLPAETWDRHCRDHLVHHPVRKLLHEDPFTRHSFTKPRGYPGDAELLDLMYFNAKIPAGASQLGGEIFKYSTNTEGPVSVRCRREIVAKMIDDVAEQFPFARMLSLACGHLREAALSRSLAEGRVGEFIALDQDPQSLQEVEAAHPNQNIRAVNASVRSLLSQKVTFDNLHLVYSAGLYDYLSDKVAKRLTRLMFNMLAPGGRLLIANFAPTVRDIGYMEAFMDWKLIYRDGGDMALLADEIPTRQLASKRVRWDLPERIVYLDICKN